MSTDRVSQGGDSLTVTTITSAGDAQT